VKYKTKYESAWTDPGTLYRMSVGDWRYVRPVRNQAKCNVCGRCSFFCPTGCIEPEGDRLTTNLDYCKGCGICAKECTLHAITMLPEAEMAKEIKK
jgi:2-oxoacid:acceptor oxidoreductase delta subunit (pyruvate/2-ketoisovalerate family)